MSAMKMLPLALAASLLAGTAAQAQLFRAYLTSTGSDANPCTLQQPCRLLPAALNAVAEGGEIWMLDSANYNSATVNVNKSVSILAVPGVVGSVVATGGPAISISAAGKTVALRNLVIAPVVTLPPGTSGVAMSVPSNLIIENSVIANLPEAGVVVQGAGTLKITSSTLRNIAGYAIVLGNGARGAIASTQLLDNLGSGGFGGGLLVFSETATTTTASLSDSVISGGPQGVWAYSYVNGSVARISVTRSTIQKTTTALYSRSTGGSAEVNFGSSLIIDNQNAWSQENAGSTILSLGDNQLRGNAGSSGTKTALPPQ